MSILKSAKRKAIDEAKRTAKDVSGELLKIPKSAPDQVTGSASQGTTKGVKLPSFKVINVKEEIGSFPKTVGQQITQTSPVAEAMQQTKYELPSERIKKSRGLSLEEEMQRLRELRKKGEEDYRQKTQPQEKSVGTERSPFKSPLPSSPRKGPGSPTAKSPKGSGEMIKQKK